MLDRVNFYFLKCIVELSRKRGQKSFYVTVDVWWP